MEGNERGKKKNGRKNRRERSGVKLWKHETMKEKVYRKHRKIGKKGGCVSEDGTQGKKGE